MARRIFRSAREFAIVVDMAIASFTDAQTQYLANISYESEGSVTMAMLFRDACRALLLLLPKRTKGPEDGELETDPNVLMKLLASADAWISNNSSTAAAGAVRFPDFNDGFRG